MYLAMKEEENFQEWFKELKSIAIHDYGYVNESVENFEEKWYRECYFDEGYSPKDTMEEIMSYEKTNFN